MYDYTIIGGGPSGIFCADKLSLMGYNVCLLESLESLGGCHRVRYVKNETDNTYIHTEHGPRIYLGAYLNFWNWLKTIDVERDKYFTNYITNTLGEDILSYSLKFTIYELIILILAYLIQNVVRIGFSEMYTIDELMKDTYFTEDGKKRLNRICRLIDGGNTDKTLVSSLFKGLDTGLAYSIYEPIMPMDLIIWDRFNEKLIQQDVTIHTNTLVRKIEKGIVHTDTQKIKTHSIILCVPPVAISYIDNASYLVGYDTEEFEFLSNYQKYEPYICATVMFENTTDKTRWGISGDHPWGLVDIDMGRYFENISGSMFIVSVTHPEKIDPVTNKTANDLDKITFLDRVVEIIQERFDIKEEPIAKTFSPSVQKINGEWIESDRAFLYSPPGWLKPDLEISKKNKVWTTGHHIGNSYHEYNSMESAIQNASSLLHKLIPTYNETILKPNRISNYIIILITCFLVFYIYNY